MSGLRVQRCSACGAHWFPDRLVCPGCGGDAFEHVLVGEGTVEETTLLRRAPGRDLAEPVPLATIRLAEGPHVIARLRRAVEPGEVVPLDEGPLAG